MISMKYIVRVKHSSKDVEPKFDEFENDTRDADELEALHDEAVSAYVSAVQGYDSGHTVSLFRVHGADDKGTGAVTVHEALGTGAGVLADEQDTNEDVNPDDSTPVIGAAEDQTVGDGDALLPSKSENGADNPRHAADVEDDEK